MPSYRPNFITTVKQWGCLKDQPFKQEVTVTLSGSRYTHDVRARALTNEFTWDQWTELRHAYLCARHHARFHADEWPSRLGTVPPAFEALVESINEVVPQEVRDRAVELRPLPPLEEVHTFLDAEIGRWLRHLTSQPAVWIRDAWDSGVLPLLILRLLEIEIDRRMGWDTDEPSSQRISEASTSYGFEHWSPVDSFDVSVEGLLEDVAYHRIAHDAEAVVTIESLDGAQCYFAASKGLVIGEDPVAVPEQGDTVRLRTWRPGLSGTFDLGAGSIEVVEDLAVKQIANKFPLTDALVRFVLLVDGGEEAPLTWVRWTANDVFDRTLLVPDEDEFEVDNLEVDDTELLDESDTGSVDRRDVLEVLRVDQPKWVSDRNRDRSLDHALLGEQAEWAYALPWMYRLISGDHPGATMPRCPLPDDTVFDGPCAYWAALWELLCFNLGWSRPARGLEWWLSTGQRVDDRKLQLIRDIWWADGQLDWFRAWLYETVRVGDLRSGALDTSSDVGQPPAQWFDRIRSDIRAKGFRTSPFGGGWDPLHLRSHGRGPLSEVSTSERTSAIDSGGTDAATLVLPGLGGWYSALAGCDNSTRIRVVVPWIGEIGVFACSPRTGLWHSAAEDVHLAGNLLK